MSIAGDLLTSAAPTRLVCRRGTWVLELVRLVAVDRNVFQPRVQRLEGAEAVLQHLKRTCDSPSLVAAAGQLMRSSRFDDERAFDAVDGEWVPGEVNARRSDSTRPNAPGAVSTAEVVELRAEVMVLRAAHDRLRERVQRLEAQLDSVKRSREVLSMPPTPSLAAQPVVAPPPAAPAMPQSPMATRVSGQAALPTSGLRFPSAATLNASLFTLTAMDTIEMREKHPLQFSVGTLGPCWLSRLIDEDGAEVGAIIADRAATVKLGGTLISLPDDELETQLSNSEPTADVLSAMNEVANHVCETINEGCGILQFRVKPLERLAPGSVDWASSATLSVEFELCAGPGRLFLFAR